MGWEELKNGVLLKAAESEGFQLLVTADKNIRYQQNVHDRRIAIVVLPSGRWPLVKLQLAEVVAAVDAATIGSYQEVLWRRV